ncbi:hypothetical protein, partial [Subtercola vilae]
MTDYRIADLNVTDFATKWLGHLDGDNASARGLLDHVAEGYDYGAHFMMANIGSQSTSPNASDDELILYAALAVFQNSGFPGRSQWDGPTNHLISAFAYADQLGRMGAALNLLESLVVRVRREPEPQFQELLSNSLGHDAAKIAAHDMDMAQILSRDIRAARLLEPSLSLDDLLLAYP